jgi:L-aspartate oxidase
VATALVSAAIRREETRGAHWREDFPAAREEFRGHLVSRLSADGTLESSFVPLASTPGDSW